MTLPSLFCLPYAGGNVHIYAKWPQRLAPVASVVSVQLPGRGIAYQQAPYTTVADLVDYLLNSTFRSVTGQVILFGHSMGALIAYELAYALSQRHPRLVKHLIVSAYRGPHLPQTKKSIHLLNDEEFKGELRRMNGTPREVLENPELMELVLPTVRADFKLCESYIYKSRSPLSCSITAIAGSQDPDYPAPIVSQWSTHTTRKFELITIPGDHFFIHTASEQLLQTLYEVVQRYSD